MRKLLENGANVAVAGSRMETAEAAVAKWLEGKTVVKAICVPGKLVNLVVK